MNNLRKYTSSEYNTFGTAPEILATIEQLCGDSILERGSRSYECWRNPSVQQLAQLDTLVWEYCDSDTDVLAWGITNYYRNQRN